MHEKPEQKKKKIIFITGTRADYGKLKALMRAVENSSSYELFVFVTGMHLLGVLGDTYTEVVKDGYKNVYIAYGLAHSDTMSMNLASTISHFTGYVRSISPDMIVVHGDRMDALAGAVVGALSNVIVAHIEGGEVSGTIDESTRHAISKFAHLHFVSNEDAKKRIMQLGEAKDNIFVIGSPDIDVMLSDTLPSIDVVKKRYEIDFTKYGILIYHSVTTEHREIGQKVKTVVEAVLKSGKKFIVIYPNDDLGSEVILNEYAMFNGNDNFLIYPSMRFEYFLTLLKNAEFIIGNSSAGIREASVYGVPAINIGTRQSGRFRLEVMKNIQQPEERVEAIVEAITNIGKYKFTQMHFGSGDATNRFMEVISREDIWYKNLQKRFIDLEEST